MIKKSMLKMGQKHSGRKKSKSATFIVSMLTSGKQKNTVQCSGKGLFLMGSNLKECKIPLLSWYYKGLSRLAALQAPILVPFSPPTFTEGHLCVRHHNRLKGNEMVPDFKRLTAYKRESIHIHIYK